MAQAATYPEPSEPARRLAVVERRGPAAKPATNRLHALTGLRALAALLVVMFHFLTIHVAAGVGPWPLLTRIGANVVANGYTGVSFFFLLSGFILAYTYTDADGRVRATARRFWRARFARIYPVYIVAIAIGFLLYLRWHVWHEQFCVGPRPFLAWSGDHPLATGLASVLGLGDWAPCLMTWNAPAWSLSAEAFFYLLFPPIALGVVRLRRPHLVAIVAACWALVAAAAFSYVAFSLDRSAMHVAWWYRYWAWLLYSNPVVRLPEFIAGVALGRLFLTRAAARGASGTGGLPRLLRPRYLSVLAALGVVALWAIGPLRPIFYTQSLIDPLYALLIYTLAFDDGPVAGLFALPAAVLLGEASYAIYILHWPIMGWALHALPRPRAGLPGVLAPGTLYFLIYLCLVVAVSIVSLYVVERPTRRLLMGLSRRAPARAR